MITPMIIRASRITRGLTQLEVAILVGVSYPAYRLWEMGGTKPTPENEAKLRTVLHLKEDASCQQLRQAE